MLRSLTVLGCLVWLAPAHAEKRVFASAQAAALHGAAVQMATHPRLIQRIGKVTPAKLKTAIAEPLRSPSSKLETHFVDTRASQGAVSPYPNDSFASVAVTVERVPGGYVAHPGKNPVVIQLDKWVKPQATAR